MDALKIQESYEAGGGKESLHYSRLANDADGLFADEATVAKALLSYHGNLAEGYPNSLTSEFGGEGFFASYCRFLRGAHATGTPRGFVAYFEERQGRAGSSGPVAPPVSHDEPNAAPAPGQLESAIAEALELRGKLSDAQARIRDLEEQLRNEGLEPVGGETPLPLPDGSLPGAGFGGKF